ncbi:conserved protein of unknown function [Mesotoga infera]|uniref:Uncharacterized protein n=1 Tax=Mesotoga infera TaxID=1236046 RepID=A0A7Z7LE14_9BACT|nr:hypothetical protein [Mesotoga infera]SSC11965.1 conserved protein of unknown function [Mesotoga infera]
MSTEKMKTKQTIQTQEKAKEKGKRDDRSKTLGSLNDYPVDTSEEKEPIDPVDEDSLERPEANDEETALSDPMTSDEDEELFTFEPGDDQYIAQKKVLIEIVRGSRFYCLRRYRWNFSYESYPKDKEERMTFYGEYVKRVATVLENYLNGFYRFEGPSIEGLYGSFAAHTLAGKKRKQEANRTHLKYMLKSHKGEYIRFNCFTLPGRPEKDYYPGLAFIMLRVALGDRNGGENLKKELEEIASNTDGNITRSAGIESIIEKAIGINSRIFSDGFPDEFKTVGSFYGFLLKSDGFMKLFERLR